MEISMKIAASLITPTPILRFRDASSAAITNPLLFNNRIDGDLVMAHRRFVVPALTSTIRIGLETSGNAAGGYVDYGEVRAVVIPAV
jgi:hypothetical protein